MKYLVLVATATYSFFFAASCRIIVDSKMTRAQSLAGSKAPQEILDSMILMNVRYHSFDNKMHKGQIVVNRELKGDVKKLFAKSRKMQFPINKVVPVVKYNWSDDSSMRDNNTSCFNYRLVARTNRPSNHSWGRAIDINPYTNPAVHPEGYTEPAGVAYDPKARGALNGQNELIVLMLSLGWEWGGGAHWLEVKGYQDYQHIQKLKCAAIIR